MNLDTFGKLVARVMERLPAAIIPHLDNVVVDVEDFPSLETLTLAGFTPEEIEEGDTLFGLFDPMDGGHAMAGDSIDMDRVLHRLIIFKRPLEEAFPDPATLKIEIRKTVVHELAHHFGWTDRDLESFDNQDNPFPDDIFEDI